VKGIVLGRVEGGRGRGVVHVGAIGEGGRSQPM